MKESTLNLFLLGLAVFLVGGIFVLDLNTPNTLATGVLYSIAVLYCWLLPWRNAILISALIFSTLIIYSFSKGWTHSNQSLINLNLALSLLSVWTCSFALLIGRRSLDSIQLAKDSLSAQVDLRTKELLESEKRLKKK